MAETTNLNIRIDKELKEQAEVFFNELGLNMTSAFNVFVRQSLRQGKIPFELSVNTNEGSHRQYILRELQKTKETAKQTDAVWHSEENVLKMLEEPV
ncbi:MAG: type II toxin-antitoxin system RelB/DinJ family antitoxin [Oscillospiraceae bacterium]|nr:type II toxin-antitoxin system RelB/DinJ family antitoxin [Oscillospiraceae bacterium]